MKPLEKLRRGKGYSQRELAEVAGVSPATIYEIEVGKRPQPRGSTLRKLAEALDVGIPDLLEEESPKAQTSLLFEESPDKGDGGGVTKAELDRAVQEINGLGIHAITYAAEWESEIRASSKSGKPISEKRRLDAGYISVGISSMFSKSLKTFWQGAFGGDEGAVDLEDWDSEDRHRLLVLVSAVDVMRKTYQKLAKRTESPEDKRKADEEAIHSEFNVSGYSKYPEWPKATREAEESIENQVIAA